MAMVKRAAWHNYTFSQQKEEASILGMRERVQGQISIHKESDMLEVLL